MSDGKSAEATEQPVAGQASNDRTLRQVVGRLASAIDRELSAGTVASLRRLAPGEAGGAAFWQVVATCLDDQLPPGGEARDAAERRWAAVLCGMAITAGLNRLGRSAGQALAQAGLSEHRFDRLLRSSGDRLHDELRTVARFLSSKGEEVDWTDLARIVLTDGSSSSEAARRTLARAYYRTLSRLDNA
jgi:CRISPR system Cascade subunit CasB